MPAFLHDRLTLTWVLLAGMTLFSTEAGGTGGTSRLGGPAAVTVAVLGIAFAKVAMVMFTFMEVRGAPLALRVLAGGWLMAALAVLLTIYMGS